MGTDFFDFVEHWATIYKPMQHESGYRSKNQRFFLTDTYMGMADFMSQIQPKSSPCIIMESNQEGYLGTGIDHPHYSIYFMVKSESMVDGRSAMYAKKEAKGHLEKFVVYLRREQYSENPLLKNITINENIPYQTVGPFYNGWFGVMIQLDDSVQYQNCVSDDDYVIIEEDQ